MRAASTLQWLRNGNQRFVSGWAHHPNRDVARRRELAAGQKPQAVVLTCSDSRLAPTILFDVGLGDLFEVRVAGNVVSPAVLGSVELAVEELGCDLVVVLGHGGCGAVQAALEGGEHRSGLAALVERLRPACDAAAGEGADAVARANACRQAQELRDAQPLLAGRVAAGRLLVVGAFYDLRSGRVELLEA